jgi:hypothetical protein
VRSAVEGARGSIFNHRRRRPNDPIGCVVERSHRFDSRDSHNRHALRLEPGVTAPIAFRPILHVVAHAVDLDGEQRLGAEEVEPIGSDRMLPSKGWASGRAVAEPAPQHRFRRREIAAQFAGGGEGRLRRSHFRRLPPPPRYAWSPSPASQGRIDAARLGNKHSTRGRHERAHPHPRSGGGGPPEGRWRGREGRSSIIAVVQLPSLPRRGLIAVSQNEAPLTQTATSVRRMTAAASSARRVERASNPRNT